MKYYVHISIIVTDGKKDNYVELKDEQLLLGSFDTLEKTMEFMEDTGKTMHRGQE